MERDMMHTGMTVFPILFMLLVAAGTAFWIWMLVDCATRPTANSTEKIVWTLIILFTHLLGALLYFVIQRPRLRASPPA